MKAQGWLLGLAMGLPGPSTCVVYVGEDVSETGDTQADDSSAGESETGTQQPDPCQQDPQDCEPALCGNGIVEVSELCDGGLCCESCTFADSTTVCEFEVAEELGCPWGEEAGSAVARRTRDRLCSGAAATCDGELGPWSTWEVVEPCAGDRGCDAQLLACECAVSNYWSPAVGEDVDPEGTQQEAGMPKVLATQITLELSESVQPGQLRVRVCKLDIQTPNLQNTVYVQVLGPAMQPLFDGMLAPNGTPCSDYAELDNDEAFVEDEVMSGSWWMVSPWTSAPEWTSTCTPAMPTDPTGSCWTSVTLPAMARTCAAA